MPTLLVPLYSLTPASQSGVAHVRELLPSLVEEWGSDDVVVACDRPAARLLEHLPCRFDVRALPDRRPARIVAQRILLPKAVARHRADALYLPDGQVIGAPVDVPSVVALHFHLNFSHPRGHGWPQRAYWRLWYDGAVRRAARAAAALIAPTAAFASEFEHHVPESKGKLHVAFHGVSAAYSPGAPSSRTRPAVVVVTNRFHYKNLAGAVRIFERAVQGLHHELRVVGLDGDDTAAVLAREGVDHDPSRVRPLGRLSVLELVEEYRSADALLFPSLVESFGLPVVEAMACGLPVACSDLDTLTEVTGGAALLASPKDEAAFAAGLRELLTDVSLAERQRVAGIERARSFRWEEAGRATATIVRNVASRAG